MTEGGSGGQAEWGCFPTPLFGCRVACPSNVMVKGSKIQPKALSEKFLLQTTLTHWPGSEAGPSLRSCGRGFRDRPNAEAEVY